MEIGLKHQLSSMKAQILTLKELEIEKDSVGTFNIFKKSKLKLQLGMRKSKITKEMYEFEGKYNRFMNSKEITAVMAIKPYLSLLCSVITFVLNILLIIDM